MNDSLVSIIIPTYNNEDSIENSILSVLQQNHKKIEVLVVNDGSTDNTEKVIFELQEEDDRIKYFKIANSGVAVARNIGLENATGEFVGFVDADDYIDKRMVELLVEKATEHSCDIVSCSYERIYTDKTIPEETYIKPGYYSKQDLENIVYPSMFSNKYLKQVIPMSMWTKLFKRKVIESNNIRFKPGLKSGEDVLFTQLLLLNAESFYYIPEAKYYKYTFNDSSVSNVYQENKWESLKESIDRTNTLINNYSNYKLDNQLPYVWIRSAMTAIFNVARNKESNYSVKLKELTPVIHDENLQMALKVADYSDFSRKKKFLAYLMKRKWVHLIYFLIINYPKLR